MAPPSLAASAKPGLNLICDQQPSGGFDHLLGGLHKILRQIWQAFIGEGRAK